MDRRKFILAGGAALMAGHAKADINCSPPDYYGNQICTVGVSSLRFFSTYQKCPYWCWAACIQMVFATAGHLVAQEVIVQKLFGNLACAPAPNGFAILQAVNGTWWDTNGDIFQAEGVPLADLAVGFANPNASVAAANELAAGYPLINGAMGHATVLTAMTFARDRFGGGQVRELIVRDPYPYSPPRPNRRRLNYQELNSNVFLAAIRTS